MDTQTYNPAICYEKLKAKGLPPCPDSSGSGLSPHCSQFAETPAVQQFCAETQNTVYTPVQYTEAYNTTLCGRDEYNPTKCEEKTFGSLNDLISFLVDHPHFSARPCRCCCQ